MASPRASVQMERTRQLLEQQTWSNQTFFEKVCIVVGLALGAVCVVYVIAAVATLTGLAGVLLPRLAE